MALDPFPLELVQWIRRAELTFCMRAGDPIFSEIAVPGRFNVTVIENECDT